MDKSVYINRELSWLKFNKRVLEEATSLDNPLFERLKFLSIYSSNLDEFYMVRVGSLYDRTLIKDASSDNKTGMTIKEQLDAIFQETTTLIPKKDEVFKELVRELEEEMIYHISYKNITEHDTNYLKTYFHNEILPLLSPQIIDNKHPFPHLSNRQTYVGLSLKNKDNILFGIIPTNEHIDSIILLPSVVGTRFILTEEVILLFAGQIFKTYDILDKTIFRVTRNADIEVDEGLYDEDVDYRQIMKEVLKKRGKLAPVRLELSNKIDNEFEKYLRDKLNLSNKQVFVCNSPFSYGYLSKLEESMNTKQKGRFFFKPLVPQRPKCIIDGESIVSQVLKHDLFISYPYEKFTPIIKLIREAANDKKVVSIKITLYRLSNESKIIEALIEAADNGKEVTALVELKARFDEANNISWSSKLEDAGCKVIYGMEDLKVHSKIMLITMREGRNVHYITHVGTGNYNEKTAKLYTDCNIITSNSEIGEDAARFFNNLTLSNLSDNYKHLLTSPIGFKRGIIQLIDEEIAFQKSNGSGRIIAKFNSLTDKHIIDKLVEASMEGVKIDLLIRGICCLQSGIKGLTDNIKVTSIVGRFLEHSRIYSFYHGGERRIYISSADLMTRNSEKRVEVACPILDNNIKSEIEETLDILLQDNVKARVQKTDGNYYFKSRGQNHRINSQICIYEKAYSANLNHPQTNINSNASKAVLNQGFFEALKNLKNRLWN